jgi:GDPmannose 4,6-dehydratase
MWLILQQGAPDDYVIATGEQHGVREFVQAACRELDMEVSWRGEGETEKGFDGKGNCIVAVDARYFRPTEVETLLGDASKAKARLGWQPKVDFRELVSEMMREDFRTAERDALIRSHGHRTYDRHE